MTAPPTIYVAGHTGLVGSAFVRQLRAAGLGDPITRTHGELDLTNQDAVRRFFSEARPEYVILAAAKVGGILANDTFPAEFIAENIAIQTNVIHEAWRSGARRLLFLGSSCIYPRDSPQPIREEYLLTGPLEPTNRSYAVAKIAGIEMCRAYNRQYGTRFLAIMPTNVYGPGDNYDLRTAHVLAALIRKIHEARGRGESEVVVWGSGTPRREFIYSDDLARAGIFLLTLPDGRFEQALGTDGEPPLINIGCGEDRTILELAATIAEVIGFTGKFVLDRTKPDGTPRKLLDVRRLQALGWTASTALRDGIVLAYDDYLARLRDAR